MEYNFGLESGWKTLPVGTEGITLTDTPDGFGPGVDHIEIELPLSFALGGNPYLRLKATGP